MGAPDPRKQRLIRLASRVIICAFLDLIILGVYFVCVDLFTSTYLRMHEWSSIDHSFGKVMDWSTVNWHGSSGAVFVVSTICASLTMYVARLK